MDQHQTNFSVLERARQMQPEAWSKIAFIYTPLIKGWCQRQGLQHDSIQNVVQEVFLSVAKNLETFRPKYESGSFRSWLFKITKYRILDEIKAQKSVPAVGGSDNHRLVESLEEPDEEQLSADLATLYRRVVETIEGNFSRRDIQWFIEVREKGIRPGDVAKAAGVEPQIVYVAISRIKKRISDEYRDLLGKELP